MMVEDYAEGSYTGLRGLSFIKLIDFDRNGQEELMLVYQKKEDTEYGMQDIYTFEVWSYQNGSMNLLDSGELFSTDGGMKHISLARHESNTYIVTGGADSYGEYNFHGYKDGNFGIAKHIIWEDGYAGDGTIDEEPVSCEEAIQECDKWYDEGDESYMMNYGYQGCESIVGVSNEALKTLRSIS